MNTEKSVNSKNWLSNLILSETMVGIFGVVLMFVMLFAFSFLPARTNEQARPSIMESEWPELVIPDDAVQTASKGETPALNLPHSTR